MMFSYRNLNLHTFETSLRANFPRVDRFKSVYETGRDAVILNLDLSLQLTIMRIPHKYQSNNPCSKKYLPAFVSI